MAEMADFGISAGQSVAVVWDKSSPVEALKDLVDKLQALTGDKGQVSVENINQLLQCKYLPRLSGRDCCISVIPWALGFCFGWNVIVVTQLFST